MPQFSLSRTEKEHFFIDSHWDDFSIGMIFHWDDFPLGWFLFESCTDRSRPVPTYPKQHSRFEHISDKINIITWIIESFHSIPFSIFHGINFLTGYKKIFQFHTTKKMPQFSLSRTEKEHFFIRYFNLILWLSEGNKATNIVFSNL